MLLGCLPPKSTRYFILVHLFVCPFAKHSLSMWCMPRAAFPALDIGPLLSTILFRMELQEQINIDSLLDTRTSFSQVAGASQWCFK